MIGAMTRPVPLAARLLLGAAAALALCQAIAATGLCAGPLALLREAAQDPGLAGAGFAALLLAAAAARRKPFDAELGLTALALPVLLLTSRALDALSAGMHPVTAAAAAFALERPLGLPGFALGRALAHSPAAAMICALAWTAAPVLVALVLVRERRRDGSCDRTLLALAGLLAFSAAAHLLWPLAGPAAAFAEAFPAAPPDLPTAVALSSHHAQ